MQNENCASIECCRKTLIRQRPKRVSCCGAEDEQFKEEKAVIIKEISMLQSQQDLDQEAGDEPM